MSCILVLASNSTPTCSWRGQGNSQFPRLEPRHVSPWQPKPRSTPGNGVRTSSPGYWLCGSKSHACPPGPVLLSPTSCLL